jgi:DNA modification methylase
MSVPWTLLHGDALDVLAPLPAASVQCVVTSPPYYGLRNYNEAAQIGLEPTVVAYIDRLVAVFREVKRVLRDDGTLWLNVGDSYNAARDGGHPGGRRQWKPEQDKYVGRSGANVPGLKPKDLIGIPWRLAFALQDDGWTLRSDIIWAKNNPMPESVTDRPTRSHEYLFLFAKQPRYYYDAAAIAEPISAVSLARISQPTFGSQTGGPKDYANGINPNRSMRQALTNLARKQDAVGKRTYDGFNGRYVPVVERNKRSVWTISTQAFPESHFAVMPEKLVEPCILAGSRPGDTVLDPFVGSGTTCLVASRFNRRSIGIDLNADYLSMAERRLMGQPMAMPLAEALS